MINALNATGPHSLPPPEGFPPPLGYVDVAADNLLSPLDALFVINFFNANPPPPGSQPEGSAAVATIDDLLAADIAQHAVRRRRPM